MMSRLVLLRKSIDPLNLVSIITSPSKAGPFKKFTCGHDDLFFEGGGIVFEVVELPHHAPIASKTEMLDEDDSTINPRGPRMTRVDFTKNLKNELGIGLLEFGPTLRVQQHFLPRISLRKTDSAKLMGQSFRHQDRIANSEQYHQNTSISNFLVRNCVLFEPSENVPCLSCDVLKSFPINDIADIRL